MPESGGARNLPNWRSARATRLILTGEIIDAKEALVSVLSKKWCRPASFSTTAFALAGRIAANPCLSVRRPSDSVEMYWN